MQIPDNFTTHEPTADDLAYMRTVAAFCDDTLALRKAFTAEIAAWHPKEINNDVA